MFRVVVEVTPRFVFAENVQREPIETACDDLFQRGYQCAYACFRAADLGAPHERRRWWLLADSDGKGEPRRPFHVQVARLCDLSGMAQWREDQSRSLGMDERIPYRMDRLEALGDSQVPGVFALAWRTLREAIEINGSK